MRTLLAILLLSTLGVSAAADTPLRVEDDRGRTVSLQSPARRIVSLAPHATEILYTAGAGEYLVGTVSHSDYPAEAEQIPRVGSYKRVDYERLAALQPDLVVGWHSGNGASTIERLQALGYTVYISEPKNLNDIARSVERLGTLAGTEEQARTAAAEFRARHQRLRERYSRRPPLSVFYQVWYQPLMTVNDAHLISQVIHLCGGRNVFADAASLTPRISVEAVLARDPEVIIASGMGDERPEWLDNWARWKDLQAVRLAHLYFVPPALLQRHSPRILEGAERVCAHLEQARQP
ncbi:cobalamin-binding protein [Alkalilimnicola sp. S0819]|uniref:cobalamin-binding protein n=1 Tax=Alkalilimnicola sp. S0819 TaxID=2613922 RepID=UPI0012628DAD|nr:cobalamin-binding protein [Alkalilimnicola sp. S0819]MPQ16916.1 ABC transporter substrate-binding protein [Alkalilimnicola sp. S0819]